MSLSHLPPVLCLHLKRFEHSCVATKTQSKPVKKATNSLSGNSSDKTNTTSVDKNNGAATTASQKPPSSSKSGSGPARMGVGISRKINDHVRFPIKQLDMTPFVTSSILQNRCVTQRSRSLLDMKLSAFPSIGSNLPSSGNR